VAQQQSDAVFSAIDRRWEEFIEFAARMVRIPSVNPPGDYETLVPFLADRLRGEGFAVEIVETPPERVAAAGLRGRRLTVLATLRGTGGGSRVALVPHLDTVPAGDEALWSVPPFGGIVKDGRLWGRGACDCKGRIACFALAMAALRDAGIGLRGDVTLAATPDEEIGGKTGAGYLVEAGILRPDYAIMEGYINHVFYGNGGKLHFVIEVTGKATHPSTPWLGVSAIAKMHALLGALYGLQEELKREPSAAPEMRYTTINVGVLHGGTKSNVIAERCRAEVDVRFIPEHSCDGLLGRIDAALSRAAAADPELRYTMHVVQRDEPYGTPRDSRLLEIVSRAVQAVVGTPPELLRSRGASDSKFLLRAGVHTVSLGPGHKPDSHIHEVDENIEFKNFVQAAKATALAIMDLAEVVPQRAGDAIVGRLPGRDRIS